MSGMADRAMLAQETPHWERHNSAGQPTCALTKEAIGGAAILAGKHRLLDARNKSLAAGMQLLERTRGRYGLQTMCEGGGQANVTIIERL